MTEMTELVKKAYNALDEKKAENIKIIDISGVSVIADYFIICTAGSQTQAKSLADSVIEKMSESGVEPRRTEGYRSCEWVLLDYGDAVVHIFREDMRGFYNLEHLWGDALQVQLDFE